MKQLQKWHLWVLVFGIFSGCQKDDICPPGTETTPLLVIEFFDSEDPSRLAAVQNLVVRATGKEDNFLGPVTTNAISIPLRTDQNFTEFSFISNSGGENENEDIVTIFYDPQPEYLNRACGFKINYQNIDVTIADDENNWIDGRIILQENVEDATEAHISFTH